MSRQLSLSLFSKRDPQGPSKRPMSDRKTQDKPPTKRPKRPGEVYLDTYKAPPGITNPANNCYCNAVIQCLFNNAHIVCQLKKLFMQHPDHCDKKCCSSGMNNFWVSPSHDYYTTTIRPTMCNHGSKENVGRLHCEMELLYSIQSLYISLSNSFCPKWLALLIITLQVNNNIYTFRFITHICSRTARWFTWALCPASIYHQRKAYMEVSNNYVTYYFLATCLV